MGHREIRHITFISSLIFCGLMNFSYSLNCQTFSKHYEFPTENAANSFNSITQFNDFFVVDGVGLTEENQSYGLIILNSDGDVSNILDFGQDSIVQYAGYFGSSYQSSTSYYSVFVTDSISNDPSRLGNVFSMDQDFNVQETFSESIDQFTNWYALCTTNEGGVVLLGNEQDESGNFGSFAKFFSSSLEPLFEAHFPPEEDFFGNPIWLKSTSIAPASDGGFFIGSQRVYINNFSECTNGEYESNPLLLKISETGEELWRFETGDCYTANPPAITELVNGDVILGTSRVNSEVSTEFQNWQKHRIIRLSNTGEIVWDFDFDDETIFSSPIQIIERSEDILVLASQWGPSLGQRNAAILSITQDGELNWHRTYRYASQTNCVLREIIQSSDEGIVACGWTFPDDTFDSQDGWLIKLFSNGCLTDDCSEYNSIAEPERQEIQLSIGPNPSNGTVYIELSSHNSFGSELEIVVHNLQGVLVDNILNVSSNETIIYEANHLPAGCYIVSLMKGQDKLQTKKLILE